MFTSKPGIDQSVMRDYSLPASTTRSSVGRGRACYGRARGQLRIKGVNTTHRGGSVHAGGGSLGDGGGGDSSKGGMALTTHNFSAYSAI